MSKDNGNGKDTESIATINPLLRDRLMGLPPEKLVDAFIAMTVLLGQAMGKVGSLKMAVELGVGRKEISQRISTTLATFQKDHEAICDEMIIQHPKIDL